MTTATHPIRVLMVDDEDILCQGVKRVLSSFTFSIPDTDVTVSFEVQCLSDAESLATEFDSIKPDLLLLDYKLPKRSGLDVLAELRPKLGASAVIMVTAYATLETAVKATKLGAYDFLAKPFTPDELRSVVQKAARHIILTKLAQQMEEKKRKVRFEFLSVLAHELKAPLNAVDGYLELLKDEVSGDSLEMVKRSRIRLDGMRKLIYDLLDLTRIESGEKKRTLSLVDLKPLFTTTLESFRIQAQARNISLFAELPAQIQFVCDETEIEIVLNNLLSNSLKYNRDGGSITLSVLKDPSANAPLLFSVRDTGIGISSEDQGKLFHEFVRIRNEHTQGIIGSGLGLSTVQKLIQLYNGNVSIESNVGVGTCFRVSLPSPTLK